MKIEILIIIQYGNQIWKQKLFVYAERNILIYHPYLKVPWARLKKCQQNERKTNTHRKNAFNEEVKVNVLLEEITIIPTRQLLVNMKLANFQYEFWKLNNFILTNEHMINLPDGIDLNVENILFANESTFILNCKVKRKNCRNWANEIHTGWGK